MVKKLVTIDVNDENLTVSTTTTKAKTAKCKEETEMEKLGFVEINNVNSAKKAKSTAAKGFEKNVCETVKKGVKAKTSNVEDYFDFSFRVNEKISETNEVAEKSTAKTTKARTTRTATKTSTRTTKKVEKIQTTELKIDEELKNEQNSIIKASVNFDNEANQIIRVARIGSLFDCDIRTIQA